MHVNDSRGEIRDLGPYSTRYTKQGALLQESRRILQAFSAGATTPEVREGVLAGRILHQGSWNTRRHIWSAFQYRFLTRTPSWVLNELVIAATSPDDSRLTSLNYLYFCLRDHLTFDFVTDAIWPSKSKVNFSVDGNHVLTFLDTATEQQPQVGRWTMSTRSKLGSMLLSGLREFGALEGTSKKRISVPPLPSSTTAHLLRLLIARGLPPSDIVDAPEWHLFLRTGDVALESLRTDAPSFGIKLTRSENTFMVEIPPEWSAPHADV
jgi:hypothetical protein